MSAALRIVFQFTRPRGARLVPAHNYYGTSGVSIHAPAWGATKLTPQWRRSHNVSIHAPAWGATSLPFFKIALIFVFQFTRPRGARRRAAAASTSIL